MRLASYRFGSSLCALASIVAFFALLAAPALHIHSPLNHFRTPTVRRLVQRHTSLEETTVDPAPQPAPFEQRTPLSLPVADVAHEQAANLREVALPDSPVLRPHLKLGFSRSSASDPLL